MTPAEKDAAVLAVLKAVRWPIGPTEVARRINQPWCQGGPTKSRPFGYPAAHAVKASLVRIGAARLPNGMFVAPKD